METESLLVALEQQLLWLRKQKYTYLNLPSFSHEESLPPSDRLQIESTGRHSVVGDSSSDPEYAQEASQVYNKDSQQAPIELDDLYQQYCQCQRCPLGASRTKFVFGAGSSQSSIVFLGEGPGADEDRLGEPFVGKAGKLLTQMIQAIGISRSDVYITNAVKCRPPNNRNPAGEEIAKCFPILQKQLELINPKLIVTLGNVPTRALIQSAPGITKARGQTFLYQNWNVLPTFHPAYLLRSPSALSLAWDDFKKISKICFES